MNLLRVGEGELPGADQRVLLRNVQQHRAVAGGIRHRGQSEPARRRRGGDDVLPAVARGRRRSQVDGGSDTQREAMGRFNCFFCVFFHILWLMPSRCCRTASVRGQGNSIAVVVVSLRLTSESLRKHLGAMSSITPATDQVRYRDQAMLVALCRKSFSCSRHAGTRRAHDVSIAV